MKCVGIVKKRFCYAIFFFLFLFQTEICSSALTDVIHAVINGTDGCLFCFGHAGLGKLRSFYIYISSSPSLYSISCVNSHRRTLDDQLRTLNVPTMNNSFYLIHASVANAIGYDMSRDNVRATLARIPLEKMRYKDVAEFPQNLIHGIPFAEK